MIDDKALDTLFRKARTHNVWLDKPVTDAQLKQIYDVMKFGPTSTNALPARILFLRSREAKERLKPYLSPGNLDKTMAAPVTAIIGYDTKFYEHLPRLFPHNQQAINLYAPEEKKAFADTDRVPQRLAAGRLPHHRRARDRARRRRDVGLQHRRRGQGVLGRHHGQDQLPRQPRLRRRVEALRAQPALRVRRSLQGHLIGDAARRGAQGLTGPSAAPGA